MCNGVDVCLVNLTFYYLTGLLQTNYLCCLLGGLAVWDSCLGAFHLEAFLLGDLQGLLDRLDLLVPWDGLEEAFSKVAFRWAVLPYG